MAIAAFATAPAGASAAVSSCTLSGGVLDIDVSGDGQQVVGIKRTGLTAINVYQGFGYTNEATCTPLPDVTNTDSITIDDVGTSQSTLFELGLAGGPFISTDAAEGAGDDEIEITFNAGDGTGDNFAPDGTSGDDLWRFGGTASGNGVNLNSAEGGTADADDVSMAGVESIQVLDMGNGADVVDARGGAEAQFTGAASFASIKQLVGQGGDDDLFAGTTPGGWFLEGDGGSDELIGGDGGDSLRMSTGTDADTADGNGGTDTCDYTNHGPGVSVDLRITAAQNTVGAGMDILSDCESLIGGDSADTLIGTDGNNFIFGGENQINETGGDTLIGLGGNDSLDGSDGVDTLSYAQGSTGGITVSLGVAGAQNTQGAGTDTISNVENLTGSQFADTLTGTDTANAIDGGPAGDTMNLGAGVDSLDAYDGAVDTVDCGPGLQADTGGTDNIGEDILNNCGGALLDSSPQTSPGAGPANGSTTADATPTYGLSADEGSSFEYSVDGGAFTACGNPVCTVAALSDGGHSLRFRAKDLDENAHEDLTPITRAITIDTAPPAVPALATDLDSPANDNSPRIRGNATEGTIDLFANATCAGAPAATGTAAELAGAGIAVNVGDDTTTRFAAIARDAVDNESGCSNAITYTEDSTAPNALITRRPRNRLARRKARYRFLSDDPGVAFQCKLDRQKFKPCGPAKTFRKLRPGPHRLRVRAVDEAGNVDPTPATDRFRVVL